jgi:hypothetical protein
LAPRSSTKPLPRLALLERIEHHNTSKHLPEGTPFVRILEIASSRV